MESFISAAAWFNFYFAFSPSIDLIQHCRVELSCRTCNGKTEYSVLSITQVDLVLSGRTNTLCFLLGRCIWRSLIILAGF